MRLILDEELAAKEFATLVKEKSNFCIITGAGVSTASGIPDFRGENGLYTVSEKNVFDLESFKKDPKSFYLFAKDFLKLLKQSKPNSAHFLIKKLEELEKVNWIITQNIDGLHKKAGSEKVIEVHGTFERFRCLNCGMEYPLDEVYKEIQNENIPKCIKCGGILKPDVIFFGEKIAPNLINQMISIAGQSDYCLVFGSSLIVHPVAKIPECTLNNDGKLIIINKGDTPYDEYAFKKFGVDIEEFSKLVLKNIKKKFFLF